MPPPQQPQEPQQPQPEKTPQQGSRISNFEWGLVFGAALLVDGIQALLNFFAIGLAFNRFISVFMVLSLTLYFFMRGIKFSWKVALLMTGAFAAEAFPIIDTLPFWAGTVWKIRQWDRGNTKIGKLPI